MLNELLYRDNTETELIDNLINNQKEYILESTGYVGYVDYSKLVQVGKAIRHERLTTLENFDETVC